jgi:hypothetical protein
VSDKHYFNTFFTIHTGDLDQYSQQQQKMLDIKVAAALAVRLKTTSHMGDDPGQVPWKGFLVAMLINGLLLPGLIYVSHHSTLLVLYI